MSIFGLATGDDPDLQPHHQEHRMGAPGRRHSDSDGSGHKAAPVAPKPTSQELGHKRIGVAAKKIEIFKKYAGKTYGQISMEELAKSAMWLKEQAMKENKPLSKAAEGYILDVQALQNEFESELASGFGPSDEYAPF